MYRKLSVISKRSLFDDATNLHLGYRLQNKATGMPNLTFPSLEGNDFANHIIVTISDKQVAV